MATIIDGKQISKIERQNIASECAAFKEKYGISPYLAVILVGDNPASKVYVGNKQKACDEVGFGS
ncbi:MAG: tetrahydrofolate dehydrogenase/cyclohydrolase catalytic domain-containing protein, partial [Eubacteriales bacterium]